MPDVICDRCAKPTRAVEDVYGEVVCPDCHQNLDEAAWERYCEDFHDGGSTRFKSLEQQAEAKKFK